MSIWGRTDIPLNLHGSRLIELSTLTFQMWCERFSVTYLLCCTSSESPATPVSRWPSPYSRICCASRQHTHMSVMLLPLQFITIHWGQQTLFGTYFVASPIQSHKPKKWLTERVQESAIMYCAIGSTLGITMSINFYSARFYSHSWLSFSQLFSHTTRYSRRWVTLYYSNLLGWFYVLVTVFNCPHTRPNRSSARFHQPFPALCVVTESQRSMEAARFVETIPTYILN